MQLHRQEFRTLFFPLYAFASLALLSSACSSEDGTDTADGSGSGGSGSGSEIPYCEPASTCPVDVSGVDLSTPSVTFAQDVLPIFQARCNDSTCHGSGRTHSAAQLYLGPPSGTTPTAEELTSIHGQLTSQSSQIASNAQLVVAGEWAQSFFMAKVDGCQDAGDFTCNGSVAGSACRTDCGDGMPQTLAGSSKGAPYPLSDDERTTIRRWIHQGALP